MSAQAPGHRPNGGHGPHMSIVIPTWNGAHLLELALGSLRRQELQDFEIIVVDNGSVDGTRNFLQEHHPEVQFIPFEENRGFAAAVNAGIQAAAGDIVVLMNNDTEAYPDWLSELSRALAANPDVAFCASRVVRYDDRSVIDSAGDKLGLLADQIGHGEPDSEWFDTPRLVLSACAAAAAYRRELFEQIGLFDEGFASYLEDVDIGVRATLAGFRGLYVPTARIAHMGSATAQRIGGTKLYLLLRNSLFIFFQYMPPIVLLRWGGFMMLWPLFYVLRSRESVGIALRALRDFFKGVPFVIRRRRWVAENRRISTAEFRTLLSPPAGSWVHARQGHAPAVADG